MPNGVHRDYQTTDYTNRRATTSPPYYSKFHVLDRRSILTLTDDACGTLSIRLKLKSFLIFLPNPTICSRTLINRRSHGTKALTGNRKDTVKRESETFFEHPYLQTFFLVFFFSIYYQFTNLLIIHLIRVILRK